MAQRANMEERTFLRRFRKATGMTTTHYTQGLSTPIQCRMILGNTGTCCAAGANPWLKSIKIKAFPAIRYELKQMARINR